MANEFERLSTSVELQSFAGDPQALDRQRMRINDYLKSPRSNDLSETQRNRLKRQVSIIGNYFDLTEKFEECASELEAPDRRRILEQLLSGAQSYDPCTHPEPLVLQSLELGQLARQAQEQAFVEKVRQQSLQNAMVSLLKYKAEIEGQTSLNKSEKRKLVGELCQGGCSKEIRRDLYRNIDLQMLRINSRALQEGRKPGSLTQALEGLNQDIAGLNSALNEVSRLVKSKGKEDEETQAAYDLYVKKYVAVAGTTRGSLLITKGLKDFVQPLKDLDDFKRQPRGRGWSTPQHKTLQKEKKCRKTGRGTRCTGIEGEKLLTRALEQAREKIQKYARDTASADNLKDLLKTSPVSVGQRLLYQPRLFEKVCALTKEIAEEDQTRETYLNYADNVMNALDIASIGLLAVGGTGLLLKGVSAAGRLGTSAIRLAARAGVAASVARGLGGAATLGIRTNEYESITNARLASAVTPEQYERSIELEKEIAENKAELLEVGIDFLPFGLLSRVRRAGAIGKTSSRLDDVLKSDEKYKNFLEQLTEPNRVLAREKLAQLSDSPEVSADQLEAFLGTLSQMDPQVQRRFLSDLENLDVSDPRVKNIISENYEELGRCLL